MEEFDIKKTIATNITYLREKAGITKTELAKKLGVSQSSVSHWENGANSIDINRLFQLCEILNCNIQDMYTPAWINLNNDNLILPEYEKIPKQYKTLATLLNAAGFELKFVKDRYGIIDEHGFCSITEEKLNEIQSNIINYLEFNIKKYITSQINEDEHINITLFPHLDEWW